MNEKLTDRIGLLLLFFITLLYWALMVCVSIGVNWIVLLIFLVTYNICTIPLFIIYIDTNNKYKRVSGIIKAIILANLVFIAICMIPTAIRMLIV